MGKHLKDSPNNKDEATRYSDPITDAFEREEKEKLKVTTRPELDARRCRARGYFCTTCQVFFTGKNCRFKKFEHEYWTGHTVTAGSEVALA